MSDAEMRETLDRVMQCVGEEGFQAQLTEFTPGLGWSLDIVAEIGADAEQASSALDDCSNSYAASMDKWRSQNRLTSADHERYQALVRECLVANGVELIDPEERSLAASVPLLDSDQFKQCQVEALAQVR